MLSIKSNLFIIFFSAVTKYTRQTDALHRKQFYLFFHTKKAHTNVLSIKRQNWKWDRQQKKAFCYLNRFRRLSNLSTLILAIFFIVNFMLISKKLLQSSAILNLDFILFPLFFLVWVRKIQMHKANFCTLLLLSVRK